MDRHAPRVLAFVALVAVAATALVGVAAMALLHASLGAALMVGAAAFVAGFLVLERTAVTFVWRRHRISTSLTEAPIFLAFLTLPLALPVLLTAASLVIVHARSGRSPIKGVFNVAHGTIAAATGAAAALVLASLGVPILAAAIVGTVLYSLTSDLLLAALFALLEGNPGAPVASTRVYAERFLMPNALAISTAIPSALALVGLWNLHPAAVLAAAPLAFLVVRHAHLQASVDRELEVRRRLVNDARGLVGTAETRLIADMVLRSCADLLDASRARFTLADGATHEAQFDQAPPSLRPPLRAGVMGRDGRELGVLEVWERPLKPRYGDDEGALLALVANQAAQALESAQALVEIAGQRDLLARQEKLSALGMLMAGVAHEIDNPLTFMRLQLDITRRQTQKALDRAPEGSPERAYAEGVLKSVATFERGVDRLGALCSSLKTAARPGDGKRHPTSLNEVVAEVVTVVRAGHKDVTFHLDLAPDLPLVEANPAEIHQVMLNLVKNASEALDGRRGATIRVATRPDGASACVEVQDNGPGIPAETARKLFMPFFTTKKGGTGLGLSISHQVVTAHGGAMTFACPPEGGTIFRVTLPLPEVAAEAPAPPSTKGAK